MIEQPIKAQSIQEEELGHSWAAYNDTYRAGELQTIAGWIASGESGSVVGLLGSGRSNLLGFLCNRPEVFQTYLPPRARPVILTPVDLNNLPAGNLATLYRVILRAFYRISHQFDQNLRPKISELYAAHRAERDPFLSQSALQELLLLCQARQIKVVLVMNHFDHFYRMAQTSLINTLRALRDEFKDTLTYLAGMSQEVAYLPDPTILGDMYDLLDNYICWVGGMTEADARNLIARATYAAPTPPTESDIETLLRLSGAFPALLRAACSWWLTSAKRPAHADWAATLLAQRNIQHRLARVWTGLTQEEQFVLAELPQQQFKKTDADQASPQFVTQNQELLSCLAAKGVCQQKEGGAWQVAGELLATYIAEVEGKGRGKIWLDQTTGALYQGQTPLPELTNLERSILAFLIQNPYLRHTKTDLIISTWPEELRREGVSDNSLYQVIFTLRQAIEPNPSLPRYLVTWRGKPEGGYQFFPEGRPG